MTDDITEAEFIVPASDHHGHSERPYFRMSASMLQQIKDISNNLAFPYRRNEYGMVIRHAIMRHIKWIHTISPVPSITRQVEAILEIVREDEFHQDFDSVFDAMQEAVNKHMNSGRPGMAKSLLKRVASRIHDMPSGDWADMYEAEFDKRFGGVMEGEAVTLRDLLEG